MCLCLFIANKTTQALKKLILHRPYQRLPTWPIVQIKPLYYTSSKYTVTLHTIISDYCTTYRNNYNGNSNKNNNNVGTVYI